MGLNIEYLPFFDLIDSLVTFNGKTMAALGSQEMHDPKEMLSAFALKNNYADFARTHSVKSLLKERYGLASYTDYDLNNSADIKIDYGLPLPEKYHESCDILLDGGTSEHIFDLGKVFKNMHNMVNRGGVIIHMSPWSWMEHGYYNFNAKLFHFLDLANNYMPLVEGYYFQPGTPLAGIRILKIEGKKCGDAARILEETSGSICHNNTLYLHVSQKKSNEPFKIPYDIYD